MSFSSSDKQTTSTSAAPSLWDKLTGHSHSSTSTSTTGAIASPDAHISTPYNVSAGATGASMNRDLDSSMSNMDLSNTKTTVLETESAIPSSSINSYQTSSSSSSSSLSHSALLSDSQTCTNQYCNDHSHASKQALAATCTKCITSTGPMATMSGASVVDVNQTAQVHFVGQQSNATISHESAALQVQVPAQTITTTLPAKRVIVEIPERQVQVTVPGRIVQLENAPEIQVTTRPVIKAVSEASVHIKQNLALGGAEYNNLASSTNTIQNA